MQQGINLYHERQHLMHCLKHTLNNLLQQEAFTAAELNWLCDSIQAQRTWLLGNYDANVLTLALQQHGLEVRWLDARDAQLSTLSLEQHSCSNRSSKEAQSLQYDPQQQTERHQQQQQHATLEVSAFAVPSDGQQQQQETQQRQQQDTQQQQQQQGETQQQQQQHASADPDISIDLDLFGIILNVRAGWWGALAGARHWLAIKHINGQWWNLDSKLSAPKSFACDASVEADGGAENLRTFLQKQSAAGAHVLAVYKQHRQ